nr:RNA-dependent RNA polymerase [Tolivirales sp.]
MELGFRMTIEPPVYSVQQIEFCQMKPVETSNGWVMVRNIDKAREKDSMSIIPLSSEGVLNKWLYAVGECGLALCGGVPIMQALYSAYMRQGVKSRMGDSVAMQSGARMLAKGMSSKWAPISDKARLDVFVAWGYTPDEQVAMEEWYDSLSFGSEPHAIENLEEIDHAPL